MNQTPEQIARDRIDQLLEASGWVIQDKKAFNLSVSTGIAIREWQTDVGPADYVLFVDKKPVGIIEAKREEEGVKLTVHEDQSSDYAKAKLKHINNGPLPFVYESTGAITRFTDHRDPKPRSRPVFTFHRPETFQKWLKEDKTLRARFFDIPGLPTDNLRDCQVQAITNLEQSFRESRPKALIQMATGSGKTFTAISFIYRLLKFAKAKRVLFLVDTKNLGEQAEQEFKKYEPQDDNRLFPELYGVTRLSSSFVPSDSEVYISTIQRLYSILKGTPLDEKDEEENPNEDKWQPKEPMPVVYNAAIPMEFFDFVVIDECHRSIYNLWKQVLDYFDAFQIGLTATPDNRTFGYFDRNLVCDYGYLKAVEDGVLVPYNVFEIVTKVTQEGARIDLGEYVSSREKLTRKEFWNQLDEEVEYNNRQLDDKVVNVNQIRLIVRAVKDNLPAMFPDRVDAEGKFEVPKMLIFAKSDSHADDIIHIVREEFAEENKFCKKITYRSEEDPKSVLQQFRNSYYPRVAVTVDMIATGTDIRPLEVLLFMRDVKSRSYYEQMKGRGTRTCSLEELKATGTPTARFTKDHFVIIDAIGVEKSRKTDSRPLEKKPGLWLKQVLEGIAMGNTDEAMLSTLANRLIRLDKQINEKEKMAFAEKTGGYTLNQVVKQLLHAHDPDTLQGITQEIQAQHKGAAPATIEAAIQERHQQIINQAVALFDDYEVRDFVVDIRRKYEQIIDHINPDELVNIGWVEDNMADAEKLLSDFRAWIEEHKTEITALQLFYGQPYQRRELTYKMIKELVERIKTDKPGMAPLTVWRAYEQLEKVNGQPKNEMMALVGLIRRVSGLDDTLTAYDRTVDRNFQDWVFRKQAGVLKFSEEQMQWLRMIKEYVASSFRIEPDDFDLSPFNAHGGLGKMWALFGEKTDEIMNELNEELAA
ncbi:type I restriction endonuclease subunit R [Pontibacter virosus]|uniref:Type I restriction enzyme R subunit n=1 Tax=Pontibacter virosus TaxID=1765052 RepID=A0A2U1B0X2_9BACT|nr:DEAD/DEAH box helicase family protein [Pontibacter virosus]PVY42339.1 type I restriction enzyme R subunit [Pontibacter virosus]